MLRYATVLAISAAVFSVAAFSAPPAGAQQLPREPGPYQAPPLYDELYRPNQPQVGAPAPAPATSHWSAMGRPDQFRAGMARYGTDSRRAYSRTHALSNLPARPAGRAVPVRPGAPPLPPWQTGQ